MRFQIYKKPRDGKYYFKLKAKNGWPLLTSKAHESVKDCEDTIEVLRRNATDDEQYERKIAKNGRHYFEIKDEKTATLAVSRLYKRRTTVTKAIKRVQTLAPKSVVIIKQPVFKASQATKKKQEEV